MDNTLKVTIIVPIYNVEGYIRQSIESIIKQKYTNFEAILVDDGSTDMSYQLAKRYTQDDDRFILIQTANFGQSHARNVGLKKATGDLIAFLDPDDIYDPLFLYDAVLRFDDDTDLISYLFPKQKKRLSGGDVSIDSFISEMFLGRIGTVVWNKVFRRKTLCGVFFPEGEVHEEILFFMHAFQNIIKCKIIDEDRYFYRENRDGNTNMTFDEGRIKLVNHQLDFIEWAHKEGYSKAYSAMIVNVLIFLMNYIRQVSMLRKIEYKNYAIQVFNDVFLRKFILYMVFEHRQASLAIIYFRIRLMLEY